MEIIKQIIPLLLTISLALFVVAQPLRYWVIRTLGRYWNIGPQQTLFLPAPLGIYVDAGVSEEEKKEEEREEKNE